MEVAWSVAFLSDIPADYKSQREHDATLFVHKAKPREGLFVVAGKHLLYFSGYIGCRHRSPSGTRTRHQTRS